MKKHPDFNEFGDRLDPYGYSKSILQTDMTCCYLCGSRSSRLDRHEVFPSSNRTKSKSLGLWVMLCHSTCHEGSMGVHQNAELAKRLKKKAQEIAMNEYGWTTDDFISRFGKNYT